MTYVRWTKSHGDVIKKLWVEGYSPALIRDEIKLPHVTDIMIKDFVRRCGIRDIKRGPLKYKRRSRKGLWVKYSPEFVNKIITMRKLGIKSGDIAVTLKMKANVIYKIISKNAA